MIGFLTLIAIVLWFLFWEWVRNLKRFQAQSTSWMTVVSSTGCLTISLLGLYYVFIHKG